MADITNESQATEHPRNDRATPRTTLNLPALSLVVLVGASGCGKSTFARKHFRPTEVLSSDFFRAMVAASRPVRAGFVDVSATCGTKRLDCDPDDPPVDDESAVCIPTVQDGMQRFRGRARTQRGGLRSRSR